MAAITVVALAGFRGQHSTKPPIQIIPDMDQQPRFDPQHTSAFFADNRSQRPPVPGTVTMGYALKNAYSQTTGNNNKFAQQSGGFSDSPDYAIAENPETFTATASRSKFRAS